MSLDVGKVVSLNKALQTKEGHFEALQSLNALLECLSNADIQTACSIISPQQMFLLLDSTDGKSPEEVELICSVVLKMLLAFPASEISNLSQFIELGLQHEDECVRKMTLRLLMSGLDSKEVVSMIVQPTMFHLVTQLLGDESLDCAKHSNNIITAIARCSEGATIIASLMKGLDIDLKGLMAKSDIVRYRVFDLVMTISCVDKAFFDIFKDLGYLEMLISDLETNDVLLKLNCLEVLEVLMGSRHGCEFVQSSDVLIKLHLVLELVDSDPLSSMLVPGILKFFGHFSKYSPSASAHLVSSRCPLFLHFVFSQILLPQDETVLKVAMETFGLLGSSHQLRPILLVERSQADKVVKKLWEDALHSKSGLQVQAFDVLSAIFSCEMDEMLNSDWFNLCPSQAPLSVVMEIVRRPFIDLQLSGLRLILSIATWEWGQRLINKCPGLVELLLDRKTVSDQNGKRLKFQILSTLANSSSAEVIFGSPVFLKFKEYEREGIFHVAEILSVATDEL